MERFRIAGVTVDMELCYDRLRMQAEPYRISPDENPADITLRLEPENYEKGRKKFPWLTDSELEYLLYGFLFYDRLLDFDGVMIHASAVATGDWCYLFSADSGVGKSTHTRYWLELLGDKAVILNDDKPAIRKVGRNYYAYGTPFSGKHNISVNRRVPVGGICFLTRGQENKICRITPVEAIGPFLKQTSSLWSAERTEKRLAFLDGLMSMVPLFKMQCINDISAAETAFHAMQCSIPVHIDELMGMMKEQLSAGGTVNFRTKGKSMSPMLVGGRDSVTLKKSEKIHRGDVVLYRTDGGKYVLHRVKRIGKTTVTTRGDSLKKLDAPVQKENIVGTVVAFERDGQKISVTDFRYRVYAHFGTTKMGMFLRQLRAAIVFRLFRK